MRTHTSYRPIALAAIMACCPLAALAQDASFPYMGLGVGQSRVTIDEARITERMLGAGLSTTAITQDRRSTAYQVFGGYQFNPYFALEGGWFKLGHFGFRADTAPAGTLDGTIRVQGINADAVGLLPVTPALSLLGRVGVQMARTRDDFVATGAVQTNNASPSRRATNLKVGLGLQYAVASSMLLRAEAEQYRINDAIGERGRVNVLSLSVVIPFGGSSSGRGWQASDTFVAPRVAAAPAPMAVPLPATPVYAPAPAAAPAPVVVAVAPPAAPVATLPPTSKRVHFTAESLFGFDHATVRPAGRVALDGFVAELNGTRFNTVSVEGHTDRLGTEAYNQVLSQQRADVVKAYLVNSGRLDPSKLSAVGKGESAPVTQAGDCVGNQASAQLITCLQPDRRVAIEVDGTR